jgi:hypothetical protein
MAAAVERSIPSNTEQPQQKDVGKVVTVAAVAVETNGNDDIQTIQEECSTMISLLRDLEKEEHDLQCQLEILAKEALLCGFQNDVIEPPIPKKRNKTQQQQQQRQKQRKEKISNTNKNNNKS